MNRELINKLLINLFHSVIFIVSFLLVYLFVLKFQKFGLSEDFPWLLATGKYILSNQLIPQTDIFSWTNSEKNWMVYQWLFEVFIAFVTIQFNIKILLTLFIFLTFVSYIFIPSWVSEKNKTPFIFTLFISGISLFVASLNLSVRPTVFTSLFLAFQFVLLNSFDHEKKSNRPLFFLLFFLTYVFWANMHLVIFLGFIALLAQIIGDLIDKKTLNKNLVFALFFAFLGSLVNPYGFEVYKHLFKSTTTNIFIHGVNELSAPDFGLLKYQIFLLMFLIFISLFVFQITLKKKIFKTSDFLILTALSIGTFLVQRFVVWFCLFYALIIPSVLNNFLLVIELEKNHFLQNLIEKFNFYKKPCLIFLLFFVFIPIIFNKNTNEYGVCQKLMPSVKKYLLVSSQEKSKKIFNDPLIGSCFLYHFPKAKVYGDTRFDFYGPDFVNDWISALKDKKNFQQLLENKKLNSIFITKEWPLANDLKSSNEYKKLFEDSETIVFERVIE